MKGTKGLLLGALAFWAREGQQNRFTRSGEKVGILYKADPDPDLQKSEPQTFRKSGPYIKIHCISLRLMFDKFEVADFKEDNSS